MSKITVDSRLVTVEYYLIKTPLKITKVVLKEGFLLVKGSYMTGKLSKENWS